MNILDIEIGQTVKLNKSPTYGEASDYLCVGYVGEVIRVHKEHGLIDIDFGYIQMVIDPMDVDPILN